MRSSRRHQRAGAAHLAQQVAALDDVGEDRPSTEATAGLSRRMKRGGRGDDDDGGEREQKRCAGAFAVCVLGVRYPLPKGKALRVPNGKARKCWQCPRFRRRADHAGCSKASSGVRLRTARTEADASCRVFFSFRCIGLFSNASYAVSMRFRSSLPELLQELQPHASYRACDELLEPMKAAKTGPGAASAG